MPQPSATRRRPAKPQAKAIPSIAVIVSRYNTSITDPLLIGALEAYERAGGDSDSLTILHAPGAYELPMLALAAAESGRFAGVVCLGCVIKGQTKHDRYINQAVARGLMDVSLHARLPVAFGVLTVENAKQARDRAGGSRGNKGAEAMRACLDSLDALAQLGATAAPSPRASPDTGDESPARRPAPWPDKGALGIAKKRTRAARTKGRR